MYLCKIEMKPSASRNSYEWHRLLWQHFPDREDDKRDFLFRIEEVLNDSGNTEVLLQSKIVPQDTGNESRVIAGPKLIESNYIILNQIYRFKVTANVIKKIKDINNPERSVRVPLIKEDEQVDWIKRKFNGAGSIIDLSIKPNPPLYFNKKGVRGKLVTITFEGTIKIICPNSMLQLVCQGIGPAKGFGCGLISLAKVFE